MMQLGDGNNLRPYAGDADLATIRQAVGAWNVSAAGCGCIHVGDVCHHLSNGLRGADPGRYLYLCEGGDGRLRGVLLLYKKSAGTFVLTVHPRARGGELEAGLIRRAEQLARELAQDADQAAGPVSTDAMDCDRGRAALLQAHGFVCPPAPSYAYTTRPLMEPLPAPRLPAGFRLREDFGPADAPALGAVHSGAFGSSWPGDAYRAVMQSPAFRCGHEMVVVAPGGRFAAFLVYWLDPVSKSGLFEPVGCHPDFQRRGLTQALMYAGLRQMYAAGMTAAVVLHELANPAASALYASVGFRRKYVFYDYAKP
jgi:mycothiol synthase